MLRARSTCWAQCAGAKRPHDRHGCRLASVEVPEVPAAGRGRWRRGGHSGPAHQLDPRLLTANGWLGFLQVEFSRNCVVQLDPLMVHCRCRCRQGGWTYCDGIQIVSTAPSSLRLLHTCCKGWQSGSNIHVALVRSSLCHVTSCTIKENPRLFSTICYLAEGIATLFSLQYLQVIDQF